MPVDILLGLQWGDEGKGKIVDVLTPSYQVIARFQGGPNAGHTLHFHGQKHVLHLLPSGIFHPETENLIGNGVIIDPFILLREIEALEALGLTPTANLLVSHKAHLILPTHRLLDAAQEASKGAARIGSTLKGIGPAYADKTGRLGLRVGDLLRIDFQERYQRLRAQHLDVLRYMDFDLDTYLLEGKYTFPDYEALWMKAAARLKELRLCHSEAFVHQRLQEGMQILAEGAQGTMLDLDFGSYPFVTSSHTTAAGACTGLGIPPSAIRRVYGIAKAYCTRVGSGPFPTELEDQDGQLLRDRGHEYGSTTGRPRRCGWLDLAALKYAIAINGVTDLILTKTDVLDTFPEIKVGTHYQMNGKEIDYLPYDLGDPGLSPVFHVFPGWKKEVGALMTEDSLPDEMRNYIQYIENQTGVQVSMISCGPDRSDIIIR
ncbi:MAG TPA: adenylosuccinate synthase [Bacteroidales bacterium]|nr:adenylosuccinate synthase [Bacteroidales bacterium]